MIISPGSILPSQDFLKPKTVTFIFECIRDNKEHELPPPPILREDEQGNLVAIDGHNLIAVRLFRNEDIEVHIAKNAHDGLPATSDANIRRNRDLQDNFEIVLQARRHVLAEGIETFHDLIARYDDLFRV